jgi:hypothetical protein
MNTLKAVLIALAVAFGAIFAHGTTSQAASIQPVQTVDTKTAVEKIYDDWHSRWRSHHRWGSHGYDYHGRWRSHHRWGSHHYDHSRWRSHHRWGSHHYGHSRWRSHHRWGSHHDY